MDNVLLYTDGLVEARRADWTFVPVDELIAGLAAGGPSRALATMVGEFHERIGGRLNDDLVLLLVEYAGEGEPRGQGRGNAEGAGQLARGE